MARALTRMLAAGVCSCDVSACDCAGLWVDNAWDAATRQMWTHNNFDGGLCVSGLTASLTLCSRIYPNKMVWYPTISKGSHTYWVCG
jgi:hypothetical protein